MISNTLALFVVLDSWTDARLWPRVRRLGVHTRTYQIVRYLAVRLPMIVLVYLASSRLVDLLAASVGADPVFGEILAVLAGVVAVAVAHVLIWTAISDTGYHVAGAEGPAFRIPLSRPDHDHKGPIAPAVASDLVGDSTMDEAEYRTASVAAGCSVLVATATVDAAILLALILA